jgi:hypothetical protein
LRCKSNQLKLENMKGEPNNTPTHHTTPHHKRRWTADMDC